MALFSLVVSDFDIAVLHADSFFALCTLEPVNHQGLLLSVLNSNGSKLKSLALRNRLK